jgi:hypothetical protein
VTEGTAVQTPAAAVLPGRRGRRAVDVPALVEAVTFVGGFRTPVLALPVPDPKLLKYA